MRGRRGVVLAAVLLAGTALVTAASLAALLGWMQLEGARYARQRQVAHAAARSGITLLDAVLAAEVAGGGGVPEGPPELPAGSGFTLRVVGYRPLEGDAVEVEVEARVPGASATAGARLAYP
ncbi:MAG: hypothetical protein U5K81_06620 [Trueperaceae bacterium]|nr:hypothetical protein [Trueperaceae bacterium]